MSNDPNRDLAQQRLNMGKDPGGSYADLNAKYEKQQYQHNQSTNHGANNSCFTGDTEVLTPKGWKQIKHMGSDESVLSLSKDSAQTNERHVITVKRHLRPSRIWEIRFDDSDIVIKTTQNHTFLTHRGWQTTQKLKTGDITQSSDIKGTPKQTRIASVTMTEHYEPTYNLVTYGDNNFILKGVVAHNFTHFRVFRSYLNNLVYGMLYAMRKLSQHAVLDAS